MRVLASIILVAVLGEMGHAQMAIAELPGLTADRIYLNRDRTQFRLMGNVEITLETVVVKADGADVDGKTGVIRLQGNVEMRPIETR